LLVVSSVVVVASSTELGQRRLPGSAFQDLHASIRATSVHFTGTLTVLDHILTDRRRVQPNLGSFA
jgi:hypothetical protein